MLILNKIMKLWKKKEIRTGHIKQSLYKLKFMLKKINKKKINKKKLSFCNEYIDLCL